MDFDPRRPPRWGFFSFLLGQLGLGRGGWVEGVGVGGVRGGGRDEGDGGQLVA